MSAAQIREMPYKEFLEWSVWWAIKNERQKMQDQLAEARAKRGGR